MDIDPSWLTESAYLNLRSHLIRDQALYYRVLSSREYRALYMTYCDLYTPDRFSHLGPFNLPIMKDFLGWAISVWHGQIRERFFSSDPTLISRSDRYADSSPLIIEDHYLPIAMDTQDKADYVQYAVKLYKKAYPAYSGGFLHRLVAAKRLGPVKGLEVDHINGNTLDCRSANLRICTKSENNRNKAAQANNSSKCGYKGVALYPDGLYRAQIAMHGKTRCIGFFDTAKDAALAYDVFSRRHHGEHGYVNFPDATKDEIDAITLQIMSSKTRRGTTSQYYGVSFHKGIKRWRGDIRHRGQYHYLGYFPTEMDAALAVDKKLLEIGCRHKLNFGKTPEDVLRFTL